MTFTTKKRQALFLEMAGAGGATAQEVYEAAIAQGDDVSLEAYFNLGRRLAHRGLLLADKSGDRTAYVSKLDENGAWLDEDQLVSIIDPEYPISALTAFREAQRQARDIPESVWIEARDRLRSQDARALFSEAIRSYADNLRDEIEDFARERSAAINSPELANLRRAAENTLATLMGLCKDGMGLSDEAIRLPVSIDNAAQSAIKNRLPEHFYNESLLWDELSRRIEAGPLVRDAAVPDGFRDFVVAGIDGSSVGGLLALDGANGDMVFGHAPQVSINTATGVLNPDVRTNAHTSPAYLRLPEKPEDMQQRDNRYSIMAKMFHPDLTDTEYVHSTWNAMDLLECRATLAVMGRWVMPPRGVEIPPADVVIRDGTIVPNDRDASHYGQQNTYGRIVRDLIEACWKIIKNVKDDGQTVLGVVKNAQMRVFGPVVNYALCQQAMKEDASQLSAWSLSRMNLMFDQALLTRLLTAGRTAMDPWWRTAVVLRPFHATSNLGKNYSREEGKRPFDKLVAKSQQAQEKASDELTQEEDWWARDLRVPGDPYLQMLRNVWYAGFYLGALPRLDLGSETLTRLEFVVPHSTDEVGAFPEQPCAEHLGRAIAALRQVKFEVSKEHAMFGAADHIDLLPSILVLAHDTVKTWAKELRDRVSEYMDWQLAKYLKGNQKKHVRLRPWKRQEMEAWIDTMQTDRRREAVADERTET